MLNEVTDGLLEVNLKDTISPNGNPSLKDDNEEAHVNEGMFNDTEASETPTGNTNKDNFEDPSENIEAHKANEHSEEGRDAVTMSSIDRLLNVLKKGAKNITDDGDFDTSPNWEAVEKKRKLVGFSEEPNRELWEHHKALDRKEKEANRSNPFHKIPAELAYLEKKAPPPQPLEKAPIKRNPLERTTGHLGDLRNMPIKQLSAQNKATEVNFDHTAQWLPVPKNKILVDVKYSSILLIDIGKLNRYILNLSETKVGFGYEFAGVVSHLGTIKQYEFKVGDFVYGVVNSEDKKGLLSSSLLIDPGRDVIIKIEDEMLAQVEQTDIKLTFDDSVGDFEIDSDDEGSSATLAIDHPKQPVRKRKNPYALDQQLPPLAKFSAIPALYCRARQVLSHLKSSKLANILINGGDTVLGQTIVQVLLGEHDLTECNIILVGSDARAEKTMRFVNYINGIYYDPSKNFTILTLTFDLAPETLPGEKAYTNWKKRDYFAMEVIDKLFANHNPRTGDKITSASVNQWKLDLFVDIIGLRKYFQHSVHFDLMDDIKFPVHEHLGQSLHEIFTGKDKQPLFMKLLKPKKTGSAFVSMCEWGVREPLYSVDKVLGFKELSGGVLGSTLFNVVSYYNYYNESIMKLSEEWINAAFRLVVDDKLKYDIVALLDWRDETRKHIAELRKSDQKVVFKIEDI